MLYANYNYRKEPQNRIRVEFCGILDTLPAVRSPPKLSLKSVNVGAFIIRVVPYYDYSIIYPKSYSNYYPKP